MNSSRRYPCSISLALLSGALACSAPPGGATLVSPASTPSDQPAVILMIGDGMGFAQIEASSLFATGRSDGLFMSSLPVRGRIVTGSLTGITDSAAAGTAMACGVPAYNEHLGLDAENRPVQNLVELAHAQGWAAGIVTTTSIADATPASFAVHARSRHGKIEIANRLAANSPPEIMLGGGAKYFLPRGRDSAREDDGLIRALTGQGYGIVRSRQELGTAAPGSWAKLVGLFANDDMERPERRGAASGQPTLAEMSLAALERLGSDERGFFLMIEEERTDTSGHKNDLAGEVRGTIAFDEAVRAVAAWAEKRPNVTLLVTADHETGGLEVVRPAPKGELSEVAWTRKGHTNALVGIFASGKRSETFQGTILSNRWIHAVASARIESRDVVAPPRVIVPDGDLRDLRHTAALQEIEEMPGQIRLESLKVDVDSRGLAVGVEGLFEQHNSALVILIDADFGTGTGLKDLTEALHDTDGAADRLLSALKLDGSGIEGFGADFAIVEIGGTNSKLDTSKDRSGARAFFPPGGSLESLGWLGAAVNFGPLAAEPEAGASFPPPMGMEAFVPWDRFYPGLAGTVPRGARLAMAAFLMSVDGSVIYNQALPHFPAGVDPAQRGRVAIPGLVVFDVDPDRDGVPDGGAAPRIVWSGGPATSPPR